MVAWRSSTTSSPRPPATPSPSFSTITPPPCAHASHAAGRRWPSSTRAEGKRRRIEQHAWVRRRCRRLGDGDPPRRPQPQFWVSAWGSSPRRCPACDLPVFSLPPCLWPVPIHVCRPAQVREKFQIGNWNLYW